MEISHHINSPITPIYKRLNQLKVRSQLDATNIRKSVRDFPVGFSTEKGKGFCKQFRNKLQLIRSKCLGYDKTKPLSSNTISHLCIPSEPLDESMEIDTDDMIKENNEKIWLINSIYEDRPPTIFFKYPSCCGVENLANSRIVIGQGLKLNYKITGHDYKCIINSLEYNGFKKTTADDWTVYFDVAATHLKQQTDLKNNQRVNHFYGCWQLGLKDCMYKNLQKQKRAHPEEYNFVPFTYLFPTDYMRFQLARQCASKDMLWIMKPSNQACGRGIKIIGKNTPLKNKKDRLVSEYISRPHLINGLKYDLRIYVLVTNYDPLIVFMFQQGLTRFATSSYSTGSKSRKQRFVHLTNFSVNKHSQKFVANKGEAADGQGSKWSLGALKRYYESKGIDVNNLFQDIKSVIIKTCISVEPIMQQNRTFQKRNCAFQLYGFDILIDSNLKPWLMQVNVCPSLSSSSPLDRKIKHTLLTDTLNTIGIPVPPKKNTSKSRRGLFNLTPDKKYYSKNINLLQNLTYETCLQILSAEDWQILFQFQEKLSRKGHFQLIFPKKDNIEKYSKLFQVNRYSNNVLWKHILSPKGFLDRIFTN